MQIIDVVYSPLCEASIAFVGRLKEWLANADVDVKSAAYDSASSEQAKLYQDNGLLVNGRMIESCFVDVFLEGKRIDSVPLNKNKILIALNLAAAGISDDVCSVADEGKTIPWLRNAMISNEISWIPITKETVADEMTMCLCNYPFGNPPARFHNECIKTKKLVFDEVWSKETCAGIYAKLGNQVIGLLEVFPREILKKYGFMTGSVGNDDEYLTVGCYEVGYGMPRQEIIDELMRRLEMIHGRFKRKMLEGIGIFEWPDGFTPYWVYDKYGFSRQEKISENKVVMQKQIN